MHSMVGKTKRSDALGALILDFTEAAIVLRKKHRSGEIEEIGVAELDAPDFSERIDALRVEALVQDPNRQPVTLWLPQSQVLERHYVLSSVSSGAARSEALRRLQNETGYAAGELAIDLGLVTRGSPTVVVAALCQTVREAIEYAKRWGFQPGRVSTNIEVEGFAEGGAEFRLPEPRPVVAGRRLAQAAAVSAVILGGGFAGLHVYQLTQPLLEALVIQEVPGHMPLPETEVDMGVQLARHSSPVARLFSPQSLPIQGLRSTQNDLLVHPELSQPPGQSQSTHIAVLQAPVRDVQVLLGAASSTPRHIRPGRLQAPRVVLHGRGHLALRASIDRIRNNSRNLASIPSGGAGPKFQRVAARAASQNLASSAYSRTSSQTSAGNASLASLEATRPLVTPAKPLSVSDASAPISQADPKPADQLLAPEPASKDDRFAAVDPSDAAVPKPRPQRAVGVTEAQSRSEQTDVPARVRDASRASLVPEAVMHETPDAEERLAALASPEPSRRPERLRAAEPVLPKKAKAIASVRSPARVGNAANERGLELGQTNLVGVIEARDGRRALVRLPDGDFRKVARGDDVNGWRVNSIDRNAMRLSRKGQNRTLLLVTR